MTLANGFKKRKSVMEIERAMGMPGASPGANQQKKKDFISRITTEMDLNKRDIFGKSFFLFSPTNPARVWVKDRVSV